MTTALQRRSVLIVEDDVLFRSTIQQLLESRGYAVHGAGSASEAIDALIHQPVDLVLLDLHFPGGHGLTLLREIATQRPELQVVVMSGKGEVEDVIAAFRGQAADYLAKPFAPQALIDIVERCLTRDRPLVDLSLRPQSGQHDASWTPAPGPASREAPPHRRHSLDPQPLEPRPARPPAPAPPLPTGSASGPVRTRLALADLYEGLRTGRIAPPVQDARAKLVRTLMTRRGIRIEEIVSVVSRDPALVGAIIGRANEGVSTRRRICGLRDACVLLGNDTVFDIAAACLLEDNPVPTYSPAMRHAIRSLHDNTVRTAEIAQEVARRLHMDTGEANVAALLHNVGESVLFQYIARSRLDVDPAELADLSDAHHEELAAVLTERWGLPETIRTVCRSHHHPDPEESEATRVLRLLVVGSWAKAIGEGWTYLPTHQPVEYADLAQRYFEALGVEPTLSGPTASVRR